MLVTVRLFARLRELAGTPELTMELSAGSTARGAWEELVRTHPALVPYEATVSCAVNAEYARMTKELADRDEVAFLPPVSGG